MSNTTMSIHKNTFGGSKAAEVLVDMLNKEDPRLSKKVCRLFTIYSQTMGAIDTIEDRKAHGQLMNVWYDHCEKQVLNDKNIPVKLQSYLVNIEKTLYKKAVRKFEAKVKVWREGQGKQRKEDSPFDEDDRVSPYCPERCDLCTEEKCLL